MKLQNRERKWSRIESLASKNPNFEKVVKQFIYDNQDVQDSKITNPFNSLLNYYNNDDEFNLIKLEDNVQEVSLK